MMEVAISEFHISYRDILFDWTFPRLALLFEARLVRNEAAENKSKVTSELPEGMLE